MSTGRVCVTGAAGRIGSAAVKELMTRGWEVLATDRRHADLPCPFALTELNDRPRVQAILEKVDALVHLGEIPMLMRSHRPEELFGLNTAAGSIALQTAADLKLRRVVYASSCQVYGFAFGVGANPNLRMIPDKLPFDETHPTIPNNAYGAAKVANEIYAHLLGQQQKLSIAIFRFPAILTAPASDGLWARRQSPAGSDDGLGSFCHVDDAARAIAMALEHPRPGCEAYNIASDESLLPVEGIIKQFYPTFPPLPPDWPQRRSAMLCEKAKEHFGWRHEFKLPPAAG